MGIFPLQRQINIYFNFRKGSTPELQLVIPSTVK